MDLKVTFIEIANYKQPNYSIYDIDSIVMHRIKSINNELNGLK